jgi:hypothetical protein
MFFSNQLVRAVAKLTSVGKKKAPLDSAEPFTVFAFRAKNSSGLFDLDVVSREYLS